ncbi:MAG TPA: hypothetical protein VK866_16675 [Acidimicrobiales bacterium]|nr:hypothetical protein [Acidimicrobiales bacterium]
MFMFSRSVRLAAGHTRDSMGWAHEQTERVNRISGLTVALWQETMSPEPGRLSWSTFVTDLEELEGAEAKLAASDEYVSAIDAGASFYDGGATDQLVQLVHGAPDPESGARYATVVQASAASGAAARSIEVGVRLAQRATEITGHPTMFGRAVTGIYGGVGWITPAASLAELQAAQDAMAGDAEWLRLIDEEAAGAYAEEPALTTQRMYRRLL